MTLSSVLLPPPFGPTIGGERARPDSSVDVLDRGAAVVSRSLTPVSRTAGARWSGSGRVQRVVVTVVTAERAGSAERGLSAVRHELVDVPSMTAS